ncbi:hypothetical protein BC938DRAFT_476252 [Jimgerdemannia flammicorona]|uniref:Uncharacterized protein n=1 Tax=Jimgerdemannia flammicorona TaxID=994334 RepID=A0A433QQT5_9FUNG|nr:hypothetical protein BC938DRAFT_476252 [Jimgerdemannia flammicorona]
MECAKPFRVQLADHAHRKVDTVGFDGLVVVLDGLEVVPDLLRDVVIVERSHTLQEVVRLDREHRRKDRNRDPHTTRTIHELQEDVRVHEQLRDDQVRTSVDLLLEEEDVFLQVTVVHVAFRVTFGVEGRGGVSRDPEPIPILLLDVLDQIDRVLESIITSLPLCLSSGRVTTQRQDVAAPASLGLAKRNVDLFLGHVGARQVHHRLQPVHRLCSCHDLGCQVRRHATGVPGDVDELGAHAVHALHAVVEVLHSLRLGCRDWDGLVVMMDRIRRRHVVEVVQMKCLNLMVWKENIPEGSWGGRTRTTSRAGSP